MRSVLLIVRSFARAKGFAAAAVLTVALGIGVNTVVFSLFDRVLFRPLPYAEPERLVQLQSRPAGPRAINPAWNGAPEMRFAITQSLAREKDLFSGMAWSVGGDPQPLVPAPGENPLLWLTPVTTSMLDVLGVRPVARQPDRPASRGRRPIAGDRRHCRSDDAGSPESTI